MRLQKLLKIVKSEDEFIKTVCKFSKWYLQKPHMKLWTKEHLRRIYADRFLSKTSANN